MQRVEEYRMPVILYDNTVTLRFPSKSSNEGFARVAVAAFVAQRDITIETLADIKTAVSEAVTNAIVHGYEDTIGEIEITCRMYGDTIEISVTDYGCGISDVDMARTPLYTSRPELERSGMGFTVMETFMDDVNVHTAVGEGTTVVMRKQLA